MLYPYRKSTWGVMLFLLFVWPAFSVWLSGGDLPQPEFTNLALQVYLPTLLIQFFLLMLVAWALVRAKESPASLGLVDFNWKNALFGIGFFVLAVVFFSFLSQIFRDLGPTPALDQYLPKSKVDYALWIVLSLSAAITEEASFRGFLITRLAPVLGSFWAAAFLSSIAFGLGHIYQGTVGVIFTSLYGFLFAILFYWRGSIVPCIIAHLLQDALAPWLYSLTKGASS